MVFLSERRSPRRRHKKLAGCRARIPLRPLARQRPAKPAFNVYSRRTPISDRRFKISDLFNSQTGVRMIGVRYSMAACRPGQRIPDFQILPAYFDEKDFIIRFANLGFFLSIPKGRVEYRRSGFPPYCPYLSFPRKRESRRPGLHSFVIHTMRQTRGRFSPLMFTVAERCHSDGVLPASARQNDEESLHGLGNRNVILRPG